MRCLRFLGASFICILIATTACSAQQKRDYRSSAEWKTPVKGLKVFRLWETVKLDWPQVAVMELSPEVHMEFHHDQKAFVNKYNIFSPQARFFAGCLTILSPAFLNQQGPILGWKTTGVHYPSSGYA